MSPSLSTREGQSHSSSVHFLSRGPLSENAPNSRDNRGLFDRLPFQTPPTVSAYVCLGCRIVVVEVYCSRVFIWKIFHFDSCNKQAGKENMGSCDICQPLLFPLFQDF